MICQLYRSKNRQETRPSKIPEEMMKIIESGKADGIIAWNPDRLARNSVDGGRIILRSRHRRKI